MAKKAAADKRFEQPYVEMGMTVLWHQDQQSEPTCPATVVAVGTDSLTLALLTRANQDLLIKDGVRHRDHPDADLLRVADAGAWSHTPFNLRVMEAIPPPAPMPTE